MLEVQMRLKLLPVLWKVTGCALKNDRYPNLARSNTPLLMSDKNQHSVTNASVLNVHVK